MRAEPGQVLDTEVWHGPALTVISVLQNEHGSCHKMLKIYQRMGANLQTAGRSHGAPPPAASPDSPRPLHLSAGTLAPQGCRSPSRPSTAAAMFCASDHYPQSPHLMRAHLWSLTLKWSRVWVNHRGSGSGPRVRGALSLRPPHTPSKVTARRREVRGILCLINDDGMTEILFFKKIFKAFE